jgi:hypothetical protein
LEEDEGLNLKETEENKSNGYMLVNTIRGNFEGYTIHEIKKAQEARRLRGMIGNPTKQEFAGMLCEKPITNCPVTVQDVHNANHFFGPDLANLRGKTTRTKPEHVRVDYVKIPRDFIKNAQVCDVSGGRVIRQWLAVFGYLLKRNKFNNDRVLTFADCKTSGVDSRTSHQSVRRGRIYCASCLDGHGV